MSPTCKRCQKKGAGCWQHPDAVESKAGGARKRKPRGSRRCPDCNRERSPRQWRWFESGRYGKMLPDEPLCPSCGGRRCTANDTHRQGRCKLPPIKGGKTCHKHGNGHAQAKAVAAKNHRQRLLDMVDPVLGQMARAIEQVDAKKLWLHPSAQRLWKDVLDRTGFGVGMKIEVEDNRESRAWAQFLTTAERKAIMAIQEKCMKRMEGKGA